MSDTLQSIENTAVNKILTSVGWFYFFLIEENPLIIIYVHADRHIEMHK